MNHIIKKPRQFDDCFYCGVDYHGDGDYTEFIRMSTVYSMKYGSRQICYEEEDCLFIKTISSFYLDALTQNNNFIKRIGNCIEELLEKIIHEKYNNNSHITFTLLDDNLNSLKKNVKKILSDTNFLIQLESVKIKIIETLKEV